MMKTIVFGNIASAPSESEMTFDTTRLPGYPTYIQLVPSDPEFHSFALRLAVPNTFAIFHLSTDCNVKIL